MEGSLVKIELGRREIPLFEPPGDAITGTDDGMDTNRGSDREDEPENQCT